MRPRAKLVSILIYWLASPSWSAEVLLSEQDLKTATELRQDALQDPYAYQIVESLTTEVGPRMAGTPGDAAAVAWAQEKFKALGFDRSWTEEVVFTSWMRGEEKAEIIAPFPQPIMVTALGRSVATPAQGLKAEIVHFETLDDLKAAKPEQVKGKIAFIN